MRVDLNADVGESFGRYTLGLDQEVIPLISSANVACVFHAGDPLVMEKTVSLCGTAGTAVGAHPGFPDLQGFGRRNMNMNPKEVKAMLLYQIGALDAFLHEHGGRLQHVKPHGALYNMAAKEEELAKAICDAVQDYDKELIVLAQSSGKLYREAEKRGLAVSAEVFMDRAYEEDGSLVARSKAGAMITDEDLAIDRVLSMILEGKVRAVSGKEIPIKADSVCVHGDGEKALLFVKKLRTALEYMVLFVVLLMIQLFLILKLPITVGGVIYMFDVYIRKLIPCFMLGAFLIYTTKVSTFLAALGRMHLPKGFTIALSITLRYFPTMAEEWNYIKDAMTLRGIIVSPIGALRHPVKIMEYVYVPMLISASKISDEITQAAITRGIDHVGRRSCMEKVSFSMADTLIAIIYMCIACMICFDFFHGGVFP